MPGQPRQPGAPGQADPALARLTPPAHAADRVIGAAQRSDTVPSAGWGCLRTSGGRRHDLLLLWSVSVLPVNAAGQVLLVRHAGRDDGWAVPGGALEVGESPASAAFAKPARRSALRYGYSGYSTYSAAPTMRYIPKWRRRRLRHNNRL